MPHQYIFQPCIPTRATKAPADPDWLHKIKHDGYRLIVQRDGDRVRLFKGSLPLPSQLPHCGNMRTAKGSED